jgi:hypothetical protein
LSEVPKPAKRLGESQRRQARDGKKQDPFPPINSSPCRILLSSSIQSLPSCRDRQSDGAVNCAAPYPPSTSCCKSRRLRPFDDHRNATDTVTIAASRFSLPTLAHRSRNRPATRSNTLTNMIRLEDDYTTKFAQMAFPARMPTTAQILSLLALCIASVRADDDTPTPTTAPVFLPEWNAESWSLVRGSVIATNPTASETTYTIFCPEMTPPACGLSLEFPFELVEGPDTVEFHGTYTSTYIVNLGCDLDGTTSAKCSGYSSYKSGYSNGFVTGPTEISWTSTLTGSNVEYGVLTMAEKPSHTDESLDIEATVPPSDDSAMPAETGAAPGLSLTSKGQWALVSASLGAGLCCLLL